MFSLTIAQLRRWKYETPSEPNPVFEEEEEEEEEDLEREEETSEEAKPLVDGQVSHFTVKRAILKEGVG